MNYRRFGRTGLRMPVLSCGGMRYQHSFNDTPPTEIPSESHDNVELCIRRALELGINHIETARGYGTSEYQLGRILPHLPRESLIVQTKVAPTADPDDFLKTVDRSVGLLKLDHIDLLSLHGINNEETLEWSLRKGGCLEAAYRLRDQGLVRHIGFATHGPTTTILKAIESVGFDYVNLHWYFINQFNWPAIRRASELDMGVFIISPSDKGGMLYRPPEIFRSLCQPFTPMQFNDLFCLARPEVHTLSIGAARPSDFDEHVAALEHLDHAAELTAPIARRLEQEMNNRLGKDWVDSWWKHIPPWQEIPGEINVFEIVRLWNLAKGWDLNEYVRMRYNLLGNVGHWFPGLKAREIDVAALGRALGDHPFSERIPDILRETHALFDGEEGKRLSSA